MIIKHKHFLLQDGLKDVMDDEMSSHAATSEFGKNVEQVIQISIMITDNRKTEHE
jgi:hypothetical protein